MWEKASLFLLLSLFYPSSYRERLLVVLQSSQQSARPTGTHLGCQALTELGWLLYGATQFLA
jgi:hypothetical protein